jgi:hypothetical protein
LLLPLTEGDDDNARAAFTWIAVGRLAGGDRVGALIAAEKSFSLDRNDPVATFVVALTLLEMHDRRAPGWLERARALAPRSGAIVRELEKARLQQGWR